MGSIFPRNTNQTDTPLICILYALTFCCMISPTFTLQSINISLDCITDHTITSPNYPDNYPNAAAMEWYITAPSHTRILVTFNDFYLEEPYDLIDIQDMYNRRPYTGENVQFPPFLTQGHSLHVGFTSSKSGRRKGFNISVSCYKPSIAISGRLVEGISPSEGFLELSSPSGEWTRVCEILLPNQVAEVICGELSYPGVKEISYENSTCTSDDLKEHCTRAPSCQDKTYRLVDCEPNHSACSSNMVVKVKCHDPGYKGCYELETPRLGNGFSFTSTARCISLCKTDDIQAIAVMNREKCVCTTSAEASLIDATKCSENTGSHSKMSVYSASVGFCSVLNDTEGGSWDSNITWFGSIAHLTCMDGYSLVRSGTLQCMPGLSPLYPVWNDSVPTCEMIEVVPSEVNVLVLTAVSITVVTVVILFIIVVYIYFKHGGSCQNCKM